MDSGSFDRIARLLGGAADRRSGLKAALGAALATGLGLGLGLDPGDGSAAGKHGRHGSGGSNGPSTEGPCKKGKNTCKRDGDCCTNFCKIEQGAKKGKCRCIGIGNPCKKKQTCCGTLACTQGVCTSTRPIKVDLGEPCTPDNVCRNADASCTSYAGAGPAGTFCLLPAAKTCAEDAHCVSAFCAGSTCAAKCTVCASGCDYTKISDAYAALPAGAEIGVAPGDYDDTIEISRDVTIRRCGIDGTVNWSTSTGGTNGLLIYAWENAPTITLEDLDLSAPDTYLNMYNLIQLSGDSDSLRTTLNGTNLTIHNFRGDSYCALKLSSYTVANLTGCTFDSNAGYQYGGAIAATGDGILNLTDCEFTNNSDAYGGAAIYLSSSTATITDCTFTGNTSSARGGALRIESSTVTATRSTFSTNSAVSGGGGMSIMYASNVTLTDCTISDNHADTYGGGGILLWVNNETLTLTLDGTTTVTGNDIQFGATSGGSGIATFHALVGVGTFNVIGAGTRVSGNATPPTQCGTSPDAGSTWNDVPGCAF